ncbi:MAG: type II toxin-antitoxin system Phd/YefM family antitoxin [Acidimicrobiales bacterium]
MDRVGVRVLRQRASELLRRVAMGETLEITDRGRPVARLTPLPEGGVIERLTAEGRLTPARGDLLEIEPLPPTPGLPLPSEVLQELRADER